MDVLKLAYSESISVLTLSALFSLLTGENWTKPGDNALAAIIYTGVIATAFAFYIQAWAQRVVSPEIAGLILLLEPVFATIFAFLILQEMLNLIEALGAILILLSIAISM
jgi:drug/metabolite transporter (DMT)-like permease